MATFSKKINIKNSAGTTQTALIYSTTGETGTSKYLTLKVDDQTGYTALVSTSDSAATSGRVKISDTTYAIGATNPVPAYGYGIYTTSGTFTVPSGVTKLKVTCVGGGAGVLCYSGSPDQTESYYLFQGGDKTLTSGSGTNTTFSTITANGATGNSIEVSVGINAGYEDPYWGAYAHFGNEVLGNGSIKGTHYKSTGYKAGTAGVTLTTVSGVSLGPYGAGGGGGGDGNNDTVYTITGASGYSTSGTLTVTQGQEISYTVGTGGSGLSDLNNAHNLESGANGAVLVEWGKGVQ